MRRKGVLVTLVLPICRNRCGEDEQRRRRPREEEITGKAEEQTAEGLNRRDRKRKREQESEGGSEKK